MKLSLAQLQDLDFNNAGSWPLPIKVFAILIVAALVTTGGYMLDIRDLLERLDGSRRTEQQLRQEFVTRQQVMANIDAYRAQLEDLQELLDTMIRQLPTGTEMPDLLEDISNTGRTHGLAFELFKPQNEQPRELYAAKPIAIRGQANYHQFGTFTGSVAALPRIVTLESVNIVSPQTGDKGIGEFKGSLLVEATLQTYRYLDLDEAAKEGPKR